MRNLVIFSGAGISAESGLKTFRDSNGLWENHSIYEVATPEAFESNPQLVLDFYNMRRQQLKNVKPNKAHEVAALFEKFFDVTVITQNVDDLHERAGSTKIVHLHGELVKVRSAKNPTIHKNIGYEPISLGEFAEDGGQWRPDIVWFGEAVPKMDEAIEIVQKSDILITVGTSLNVYPAAGLVQATNVNCVKYIVDPKANEIQGTSSMKIINEKAGTGMSRLYNVLCLEV